MSDGAGNAGWLALVALVPIVALMLTSFVKVSVVLSLLRNAIGATDAPSGLVVMGLSLVLTFFVMAPVAVDMVTAASTPAVPSAPESGAPTNAPANAPATAPTNPATAPTNSAPATNAPTGTTATSATNAPTGTTATSATSAMQPNAPTSATSATSEPTAPAKPVDVEAAVRALVPAQHQGTLDAAERAIGPLRAFLTKHASERDRTTFVELAGRMGRAAKGDELWVLAPAFLTTELREAFAIAVLVFIPFLVIDLLVGLGLAALGLATTSPQTVALPFKLLLFVAVDGWRLLVESLLRGYV